MTAATVTKGILPEAGPLRALAAATLLSRIGNGLLMTVRAGCSSC